MTGIWTKISPTGIEETIGHDTFLLASVFSLEFTNGFLIWKAERKKRKLATQTIE